MKISFTICSANYLPFAKSLADSLVKYNPGHRFFIVLLDRLPEKDMSFFQPHRLITIEEMHIAGFEEMNEKYSIFELSCAMKAFAADYIFRTESSCDQLFYFDSDILVYGTLTEAEHALEKNPILLTPHLAKTTLFETRDKVERDNLRTGIYNAGFFGLARHAETNAFLSWWMDRMSKYCYNDADHGLFVDQLWLNLVPLSFRNTVIFYNEGYNVAYWNFGERSVRLTNNGYIVNDKYPLIFFHFSGYDLEPGDVLCKHFPLYTFETHPAFIPLYQQYKEAANTNNKDDYFSLVPQLGKPREVIPEEPPPPPPPPPREKNLFKRKYKKWFGEK